MKEGETGAREILFVGFVFVGGGVNGLMGLSGWDQSEQSRWDQSGFTCSPQGGRSHQLRGGGGGGGVTLSLLWCCLLALMGLGTLKALKLV